jgi:hypothetical protein
MDENNKTLGYHRDMAAAVFGEESAAVYFLDEQIATHPRGRDEEVIVAEHELIGLLIDIEQREHATIH